MRFPGPSFGLVAVAECTLKHHSQRSPRNGLVGRPEGRTMQAGVSLTRQAMISLLSLIPWPHSGPVLMETALPPALFTDACCLPGRTPVKKAA